jgi:hypothetical protein
MAPKTSTLFDDQAKANKKGTKISSKDAKKFLTWSSSQKEFEF